MKVAVIQGGHSSEAEVSRMTSQAFQESLKRLGHEFQVFEYEKGLEKKLLDYKPQSCLLALHGTYGEDGVVQGLLEYLNLPYTGSGILASSLSFNKESSLLFAKSLGLPVLPHKSYKGTEVSDADKQEIAQWPQGYVVKPVSSGSSRGVSLCEDIKDLKPALEEALKWSPKALVEKRIVGGKELTIGLFQGEAFEPIEIRPKQGFYDIKNKYTKGATEYLLPAPVSSKLTESLKDYARVIFDKFLLKTYARVDFMALKDESEFYFIECNTLPGCTQTSLLPMALAHKNIDFDKLTQTLLDESLSS